MLYEKKLIYLHNIISDRPVCLLNLINLVDVVINVNLDDLVKDG